MGIGRTNWWDVMGIYLVWWVCLRIALCPVCPPVLSCFFKTRINIDHKFKGICWPYYSGGNMISCLIIDRVPTKNPYCAHKFVKPPATVRMRRGLCLALPYGSISFTNWLCHFWHLGIFQYFPALVLHTHVRRWQVWVLSSMSIDPGGRIYCCCSCCCI